MSTPKNTENTENTIQKYYTVGLVNAPEHDRDFVIRDIDGRQHVMTFISHESALTYRNDQGLMISDWDSLKPLALQMERRNNKIQFIALEQPLGTIPAFKSISIDDFLK